ncbi:hypothetical protein [Candidatus Burkholderia verschuerenii]|uniref:hypothetical protein n=1 Tax=Candidatus Burkholderia verschuerenii TaxID=242163 RepID=UPI001E4DBD21|nr:hypothetical protein [Candidatus Burkholderia verschuerenii]
MMIQNIEGGPAVDSPCANIDTTLTSGDKYRKPNARFDQSDMLRSNFCSYLSDAKCSESER